MNREIHILLRFLKDHVSQNSREIRLIREDIDRLLSEPGFKDSNSVIESWQKQHKQLQEENDDFILMQKDLLSFVEKYKHIFPPDTPGPHETHSILEQTLTGVIKFDPSHPEFHNPGFFRELLDYYKSREDYEMCQKLLKTRNN